MSFAFHGLSNSALTGTFNWTAGVWSAILVPSTWTPDPDLVYVSDISAGDRNRPFADVTGRGMVDGAADCNSIVFSRVPVDGHTYQGVIVFDNSGTITTSRLMIFHNDAPEWPVTPNGGNIVMQIDEGENKLFRIGTYPV